MGKGILLLSAIAALVVACGSSSKISLGDDGTGLRAINPDNVFVASSSCGAGFAHANVCCSGSQCTTRDNFPFYPCSSGETAYPDGTRCCSLADPTSCNPCDPSTESCGVSSGSFGSLPFGPTFGACLHCPPGFTGESESTTGCCKQSGNGGLCSASASGGCVGTGCPAPVTCAPSCASGFVLTPPQVDVCCRAGAARPDCYVWIPGDVNGMSCGGNGTSCACQRALAGHAYQMDCDDGTLRCTCSVDGAIAQTAAVSAAACPSSDTRSGAWASACRFR